MTSSNHPFLGARHGRPSRAGSECLRTYDDRSTTTTREPRNTTKACVRLLRLTRTVRYVCETTPRCSHALAAQPCRLVAGMTKRSSPLRSADQDTHRVLRPTRFAATASLPGSTPKPAAQMTQLCNRCTPYAFAFERYMTNWKPSATIASAAPTMDALPKTKLRNLCLAKRFSVTVMYSANCLSATSLPCSSGSQFAATDSRSRRGSPLNEE